MFRPSYTTLPQHIANRIHRSKSHVFATADFYNLAGRTQINRALRQLVEAGELVRVGYGLYARPEAGSFRAVTSAALERVGRRSRRQLRWDSIEIRADRARKPTMTSAEKREASANLREAFELHEVGMFMQRGNIKRQHPDASPERVEELLEAWLRRDDHAGVRR